MCCTYCMMGDHFGRYDPPWPDWHKIHPAIPAPLNPAPTPAWPLEKLIEVTDLIRRVKELEDRLGCPCEPNKADYLTILSDRIAALEAASKRKRRRGKRP